MGKTDHHAGEAVVHLVADTADESLPACGAEPCQAPLRTLRIDRCTCPECREMHNWMVRWSDDGKALWIRELLVLHQDPSATAKPAESH